MANVHRKLPKQAMMKKRKDGWPAFNWEEIVQKLYFEL
jgi:hypothetical protein